MSGPDPEQGRTASRPRALLARGGLIGRALLYLVFGLLALDVAAGARGRDDTRGAIERVAGGGWGRILLVALCVCLAALVIWKLAQAVTGDPVEGDEVPDRLKYGGKALLHAGALVAALNVLLADFDDGVESASGSSGGGADVEQEAASTALQWPGGRLLVVAAGLVVIGFAVHRFVWHAVKATFTARIDDRKAGPTGRRVVEVAGRVGYGTLSVMIAIIGGLLVLAGAHHSSQEIEGIAGAIQELGRSGWGSAVLWLVATGLLTFAAFSVVEAWLRRVV